MDAPEEYEKAKERFDFLNGQKEDLVNAENTLYDIIKEMDMVMKDKFLDTFEKLRLNLRMFIGSYLRVVRLSYHLLILIIY